MESSSDADPTDRAEREWPCGSSIRARTNSRQRVVPVPHAGDQFAKILNFVIPNPTHSFCEHCTSGVQSDRPIPTPDPASETKLLAKLLLGSFGTLFILPGRSVGYRSPDPHQASLASREPRALAQRALRPSTREKLVLKSSLDRSTKRTTNEANIPWKASQSSYPKSAGTRLLVEALEPRTLLPCSSSTYLGGSRNDWADAVAAVQTAAPMWWVDLFQRLMFNPSVPDDARRAAFAKFDPLGKLVYKKLLGPVETSEPFFQSMATPWPSGPTACQSSAMN